LIDDQPSSVASSNMEEQVSKTEIGKECPLGTEAVQVVNILPIED
jgi:hypothetical protein